MKYLTKNWLYFQIGCESHWNRTSSSLSTSRVPGNIYWPTWELMRDFDKWSQIWPTVNKRFSQFVSEFSNASFLSPPQTAGRSRRVCPRSCPGLREPPPSGWGSALAPARPGPDSGPEPTRGPGTGLDTTPPTPDRGTNRGITAAWKHLSNILLFFSSFNLFDWNSESD